MIESEFTSEVALRPKMLDDFIGQKSLKKQLQLILKSSMMRNEPPEHLLFAGPPGLGKTTLSYIISNQLNKPIYVTSGPSITHAGDLASILSGLSEGEILFIDEIHRISKPAQELLYIAMEDFRVDVIVGKGVGASSINLPLPRFTVVGATTRTGLLPNPLKDRFGWIGQMDFYEVEELSKIIARSAKLLNIEIDEISTLEIAKRSRGTARIANRILRRVRDFASLHNNSIIDINCTNLALDLFEIDNYGLDKLDSNLLNVIIKDYSGGPVGVSTLAVALGEEIDTIEDSIEPFLIRSGLIKRTSSGREITKKGLEWHDSKYRAKEKSIQ